nr:ubiquinone biosynthesis monooxygenase coq6, mitochondrial [Quercus suber]
MTPPLSPSSLGMDSTSSRPPLSSQRHLAKLELSDGNSLYTKLVVGADGGKLRIRELAGFKTTGWNYSQNAIICTVEHTVENGCAWQRFLPAGPIALLPMGMPVTVSKHVVLIGDAAHTVHPLAGQGVNMGFGDAFAFF